MPKIETAIGPAWLQPYQDVIEGTDVIEGRNRRDRYEARTKYICTSIYDFLSSYLSISLSIVVYIYLCVRSFVRSFVRSIYVQVYTYILSICLSIYLSIYDSYMSYPSYVLVEGNGTIISRRDRRKRIARKGRSADGWAPRAWLADRTHVPSQ